MGDSIIPDKPKGDSIDLILQVTHTAKVSTI